MFYDDQLDNSNESVCSRKEHQTHVFPYLHFYRYHFSEPQFGKDVCDRIISPLKSAIRCYCDDSHDILTTSDVYEALQARQVKGATAVVCEIDRKQGIKVNRISNFSAYHNFSCYC